MAAHDREIRGIVALVLLAIAGVVLFVSLSGSGSDPASGGAAPELDAGSGSGPDAGRNEGLAPPEGSRVPAEREAGDGRTLPPARSPSEAARDLASDDPVAVCRAALDLRRAGDAAAPVLARALRDGRRENRSAALATAAWLGRDAREVLSRVPGPEGAFRGPGGPQVLALLPRCAMSAPAIAPSLVTRLREASGLLEDALLAALRRAGSGGRAAIPPLVDVIRSRPVPGGAEVLASLARDDPEAVDLLLAARRDGSAFVRAVVAAALRSLGAFPERELSDLLAMLGHRQAVVRAATARALGAGPVRSRTIVGALLAASREGDESVRRAAVQALGRARPRRDEVLARLVEVLSGDAPALFAPALRAARRLGLRSPELARAVVLALGRTAFPGQDEVARTIEALDIDPSEELARVFVDGAETERVEASRALLGLGARAMPGLLKLMEEPTTEARSLVCLAVSEAGEGDERLVPGLVSTLVSAESTPGLRERAERALLAVGNVPVSLRPRLESWLEGNDLERSLVAARLLGAMGTDAAPAFEALRTAMLSSHEQVRTAGDHVRVAAARALLRTGRETARAVRFLIRCHRSSDVGVRIAATDALLELDASHGDAVPVLVSALRRVEYDERPVGWVAPPAVPEEGAAPRALLELRKDRHTTRDLIARALAGMGPAAHRAVPALHEVLGDRMHGRREVARALFHVKGDIQPLLTLYARSLGEPGPDAPGVFADDIAEIGPRAAAAVPVLIRALGHEEGRGSAVDALGAIGPAADDALPSLLGVLAKGQESPGRVCRALVSIGGPAEVVVPALCIWGILGARPAPEALHGLGGYPEAADWTEELLRYHLADERMGVRCAAAEALVELERGEEEAVAALLREVEQGDAQARRCVRKLATDSEVARRLLEAASRAGKESRRAAADRVLRDLPVR